MSYVHKLLTGRQADFAGLRQFGGIAGFPKPSESVSDAFVAGHASSSVSIALGMARARTLMGENYDVITVIGDGAATGGMVYEALNDAAVSREPMVMCRVKWTENLHACKKYCIFAEILTKYFNFYHIFLWQTIRRSFSRWWELARLLVLKNVY